MRYALADPAAGVDGVVAVVRYGPQVRASTTTEQGPPLTIGVPLASLSAAIEFWEYPGHARHETIDGVTVARSGDITAGTITLPAGRPGEVEAATLAAYRAVLRITRRLHLYRVWNVVPRINDDELGLERYKLFCRGRSFAFEEHFGDAFPAHLPAASAVGGTGDRLVVYFLAGTDEPVHAENPRQVPAWAYPGRYGPRSPSFARATMLPARLGGVVLISGTASVVGHESLHIEDARAQADETMRNLSALLARTSSRADPLASISLLKVFVRRRADTGVIREVVETALGREVPVLYVEADICRAELLVEIEGLAVS